MGLSRLVGSKRGQSRVLLGSSVVLFWGLGVGGCSSKPVASGSKACVPGAQVGCVCKDGARGAQACREDGSGYEACECTDGSAGTAGRSMADAGGSPGGAGGHAATNAGAGGRAGDVGAAGDASAAGDAGAGSDDPTPGTGLDFPEAPLFEADAPANAPELFGAASEFTAGELCVLEPTLSTPNAEGAMFPSNWLRPRFRVAAGSMDLFEIRLHTPAEKHDLVVYTTRDTWYLPKSIWQGNGASSGLAAAAAGGSVSVTIRALNRASPGTPVGVTGSFSIAPAEVAGSIAFFASRAYALAPDANRVFGFSVADEGVAALLSFPQLAWSGQMHEDGTVLRGYYDRPKPTGFADGQPRCIGCHARTPDGQSLVFTDDFPWVKGMAQVTSSPGAIPSYLGKGATALLKMPWWGAQTMSASHWQTGDRVLVTSYATTFMSGKSRTIAWQPLPEYAGSNGVNDLVNRHQLAWIDLESTANIDVTVTDEPDFGNPAIEKRNNAVAAAKGSAWGLIATGDQNVSTVSPKFNAAGDKIVYVVTDSSPEGHPAPTAKTADVRIVPYANRAGGASQALIGASDPNYFEYDPEFSPDGKLISFTRAPTGGPDGPYHNRFGEVTIVPAEGGTPLSLAANAANACAGDTPNRGLINASATFAPQAVTRDGKTYYFMLFTSARRYGDEFATPFQLTSLLPRSAPVPLADSTQLYLTTVMVDNASGSVRTFPAIYIWNQNRAASTSGSSGGLQYAYLTPTWSSTALPPITIAPAGAN